MGWNCDESHALPQNDKELEDGSVGLVEVAFDSQIEQVERQTGHSSCYVLDVNFQRFHALAHYQTHADVGGLNDNVHRRGEDNLVQL